MFRTLMPLNNITLHNLTLTLTALIALTTASRAQSLLALDLNNMEIFNNKIGFTIRTLLKTCKPGTPVHKVTLFKYSDKSLLGYSSLKEYLRRTNNHRKSSA